MEDLEFSPEVRGLLNRVLVSTMVGGEYERKECLATVVSLGLQPFTLQGYRVYRSAVEVYAAARRQLEVSGTTSP